MSTATLTLPRTNPFARGVNIFLREAKYEFLRLLRTRGFSFSVVGFPVVFYLFFGIIMNRGENIGSISVAKYVLASYAVFGMVGAALFGIGVGLAGELSAGWLDLKRASPMPPLAYVLAKCASAMVFGILIVSLLAVIGITLGHVSLSFLEFARMIGLTVVGVIPFACMGMALALLVPFNSRARHHQHDLSAHELLRRVVGTADVPAAFSADHGGAVSHVSSGAVDAWRIRLCQHGHHTEPLVWAARLYAAHAGRGGHRAAAA